MAKLTITELAEPRSHIVCDNFLRTTEVDDALAEIARHESSFAQGLMYNPDLGQTRDARKQNRVVHLTDARQAPGYVASPLVAGFRRRFYDSTFLSLAGMLKEPLFQLIAHSEVPEIQVSAYANGDHYDWHRDFGANLNLTVLLFLCRSPKRFRGGDLVLAHGDRARTVPFKNNRLVVFPSNTLHRVTPVRAPAKAPFAARRFSLQIWLRMKTEHAVRETRRRSSPPPYHSTLLPLREARRLFDWSPQLHKVDERLLASWSKTFVLAKSNLLFLKDTVFTDFAARGDVTLRVAAETSDRSPQRLELALALDKRGQPRRSFGYGFERGRGDAVRTTLFMQVGQRRHEVRVAAIPALGALTRQLSTWG